MRTEVINLKKMLFALGLLCLKVPLWADIAVTQGAGKTVATTTDNSREFQQIVVSTNEILNDVGIPTPIGFKQSISSYVPVAVQGTPSVTLSGNSNVNVTNPSTATVYQSGVWGATVTFNGTQNVQLQSGTNAVGTVLVSSTGVNASTINVVNASGNNLNVNIAAGSIGNTSFSISTGGVTVTQATASNLNATVTGTVAVSTGGVTATQATASNLNATAVQGLGGTNDWRVTWSTPGALGDNGAAATTNRIGELPGIYQNTPLNGTAATQGRNAALSVGTDGNLWVAMQPGLRPAGFMTSTGTISSAASATDIACLYGNASNTVLVLGMRVSGTETTAGVVQLDVVKRSAADVGVFSTMTVVAEDSTMNVGVSSTVWFTANPGTLGTAVGVVASYHLGVMATGTAAPNDIWISPASWRQRPVVLRGVAQGLCVNLNSQTVTGGSFDVSYEYEEITTISP